MACLLQWAAHSRPAHGARIRSIGRNLHQRISHLAAGLDPSQMRLNLVAGAGFVCSRETMVWKPFFLPSQLSRCLNMPGLGCVRVCWRGASQGPPRCSHMLALDTAVALGHRQCQRALAGCWSSLLSLPTPLGHGRSVSGYLLGGVCVSVCLCGCSLHCLFSLGWIKTVNS